MADEIQPSRDRFPSESVPPPPSRSSRAPSTIRSQSRFSSLAPSDAGSRIAYRAATSDFDRRTRQRRAPDGDREASNTPAPPVPALPPLNLLIIDSASAVIDIIGQLYVEDVDAEDGTADQDKAEFKQECLDEILEGLFEERTVAETISKELGKSPLSHVVDLANEKRKRRSPVLAEQSAFCWVSSRQAWRICSTPQ